MCQYSGCNFPEGECSGACLAVRKQVELMRQPVATGAANQAQDFLRRAADIMTERGKQYDQPEGERSMGKCIAAFNIVTGRNLTEAEGWLLLQILKDVRQWQRPGFHQDSADDCIAYAALKAEAKQKEAGA